VTRILPARQEITLVPDDSEDLSTGFGQENFGRAVALAHSLINASNMDAKLACLAIAVLMAADRMEKHNILSIADCLDRAEDDAQKCMNVARGNGPLH
jgi:hypothetical protein